MQKLGWPRGSYHRYYDVVLTDRALVGLQEATHRDRVLTAREDLLTYASDATPLLRRTPAAIVIPQDAE